MSLTEQIILTLINTLLYIFTLYNYAFYLKNNKTKYFLCGTTFFILFIGSLVLNLFRNIYAINWLSIISLIVLLVVLIISLIKFLNSDYRG